MLSANEPELQVQARNGKIFSHVRQKWLEETPEERVRRDARAEVEGMILGTVPARVTADGKSVDAISLDEIERILI